MPTYEFDVYVHIHGEVEADDDIETPDGLEDFIFPDGYEGEILDISKTARFGSEGYLRRIDDGEDG